MTWVLEEPTYIIILGVTLVLFLGLALRQTGYRFLLHALLGAVALTVGLLLLENLVQTDKEQVESVLRSMAQDVATNDAELICSHIYSQAPATLAQAQRDLAIFHFHNVNIKDNVEVTFEPGPPRAAQVTFTVVVDVETSGIRHTRAPSFITMTLIQEDGHWRVAQYSHDERALFR